MVNLVYLDRCCICEERIEHRMEVEQGHVIAAAMQVRCPFCGAWTLIGLDKVYRPKPAMT